MKGGSLDESAMTLHNPSNAFVEASFYVAVQHGHWFKKRAKGAA
jgi:hypothetical protein